MYKNRTVWIYQQRQVERTTSQIIRDGSQEQHPRPRPGSTHIHEKFITIRVKSRTGNNVVVKTFLGLDTKTLAIRSRDEDRDLGLQVSRLRPIPGHNELECTRVSRPWSRDHNTGCINW